ncbi:hypothetical protein Tco_1131965 [Tanacetum coccineum]|uniref:Uncharacterized protein n=1 Tax=Tanacetum coccineum TaxID=301880 RepID=A0ABQ5JEQ2_9ASTR
MEVASFYTLNCRVPPLTQSPVVEHLPEINAGVTTSTAMSINSLEDAILRHTHTPVPLRHIASKDSAPPRATPEVQKANISDTPTVPIHPAPGIVKISRRLRNCLIYKRRSALKNANSVTCDVTPNSETARNQKYKLKVLLLGLVLL